MADHPTHGASLRHYVALTKPRIVLMVTLTAGAGYWLARPVAAPLTLFHLLLGTVLVASGTNALNQILEREPDALMRRTQGRPLVAGTLSVRGAQVFAWLMGFGGIAYLAGLVNPLTGAVAAATLISYVFVYTPLKRRTSVSTLVGAVPGALPVVGGWTAATGGVGPEAWVLFWIVFLWQLPHFLALAWLYREDYRRAGFRMLSERDPDGRLTFWHASAYAAALVPVSVAPSVLGMAGVAYTAGAVALSMWFLATSLMAVRRSTPANARRVFRLSLAYLPVLLLLMGVNP